MRMPYQFHYVEIPTPGGGIRRLGPFVEIPMPSGRRQPGPRSGTDPLRGQNYIMCAATQKSYAQPYSMRKRFEMVLKKGRIPKARL